MNFLKSTAVYSTLFSALALSLTAHAADQQRLQKIFQGTNIKGGLVDMCKEDSGKSGKLSAAEVDKYCKCSIDADGKITNEQKWEIQSAINAKKNPASIAFVQQQNASLEACFGAPLTAKVKQLAMDAAKAQQAAPKK